MSYDLMVFEPSAPPTDRSGFLAWYSSVARLGDGKLSKDPAFTTPTLQAWYRDMIKSFPSSIAEDGSTIMDLDNDKRAEYRFAEQAAFVSFRWEVSRPAHRHASKLAMTYNIGFFEVSGHSAPVWGPSPKGHYALLHRNG